MAGNGSASTDAPLLANLVKAMHWVHQSMQLEVAREGVGPYNISQAILMCHIILGVTRPSDIAREMGLSRQAISLIIKQLEGKGVVETIDDPSHKLAKIVRLTSGSAPNSSRAVTRKAIRTVENRLQRRLGKRSLAQLKAALEADWGPVGP